MKEKKMILFVMMFILVFMCCKHERDKHLVIDSPVQYPSIKHIDSIVQEDKFFDSIFISLNKGYEFKDCNIRLIAYNSNDTGENIHENIKFVGVFNTKESDGKGVIINLSQPDRKLELKISRFMEYNGRGAFGEINDKIVRINSHDDGFSQLPRPR